MGCDIHVCIEHWSEYAGRWVSLDHFVEDEDDHSKLIHLPPRVMRNYALFTALAGVRDNGGHTVDRIDDSRGIPRDANARTRAEYESWGSDAHTPSWVTLAELYAYQDEHPTTRYSGLITSAEAAALDIDGKLPSSWCQGSTQPRVRRVWDAPGSPVDNLVTAVESRCRDASWAQRWWTARLGERLANSSSVRVVFWFDN